MEEAQSFQERLAEFSNRLPDDCVEYNLFIINPKPASDLSSTRRKLEEVLHAATSLSDDLLRDYIWQREPFRLEFRQEEGPSAPSPIFVILIFLLKTLLINRHLISTRTDPLRRLH